jgi:hypothetical protein
MKKLTPAFCIASSLDGINKRTAATAKSNCSGLPTQTQESWGFDVHRIAALVIVSCALILRLYFHKVW